MKNEEVIFQVLKDIIDVVDDLASQLNNQHPRRSQYQRKLDTIKRTLKDLKSE